MDGRTVSYLYEALHSSLKDEIDRLRKDGKTDSLMLALMDAKLILMSQDFRELAEAIEDCGD